MKPLEFCILLFVIISCQEQNHGLREVVKSDTLYAYDVNNILRLKGPIVNSMKNGKFDAFDSLGNIHSNANYVNDTLSGYYKEYYPSGIVKSDAYYVNGLPYGEELVFYDGYQDSMAVQIEGKWFIAPYATNLKEYNYRDLRGKIMYQRSYDEKGDLISKRGRIFLAQFFNKITLHPNEPFEQAWLIPAPSRTKQIDVEQHFVIYGPNTKDTVYIHPDSLVTRWNDSLSDIGTYKYEAVAYLIENGNTELDTSTFIVEIKNY
ncbi:hypothetical protein LVD15_26260 [Fulvivirga maritima]|uniref:toxin-antitoxin system YwqK family antitoxin n=1 Tax=Fulvivirga maritima TaxID=2904247 RepID=UPI001F1B43D1|nr:hypothetical protein [Fulvivirga maritima]UII26757.1 hypothetical protein LVD15_26260 [Fulvivirga maritima]